MDKYTLQSRKKSLLNKNYQKRPIKSKNIEEFLKEKANKTKEVFSSILINPPEKEVIPIAQEKYINDISKHAQKIIPTPMLKSCECKILHLIPKKLQKQYSSTLKTLMDECQNDWNSCIHELVVKSIIRDEPGVPRKKYKEKLLQFGGRTKNYHEFLKTKRILKDKLVVMHPFMRKILDSSVKMLPKHLVNFSTYRNVGLITIDKLLLIFNGELRQSELKLLDWYKFLQNNFKHCHVKSSLTLKSNKNLYSCVKNSIIMQIEELMRETIEHVIDVVADKENIPMICMELKFNSNIYLEPSLETIYTTYNNIIQNITLICQELRNFVEEDDVNVKYIPIEINVWVLENSQKCLRLKLKNAFEPVLQYINDLKFEYQDLINDCVDYKEEELTISYEKIKIYKAITDNLTSMINSKYFSVGKLDQSHMINTLKDWSLKLQQDILDKMTESHKQEVSNICLAFEEIAARAMAVPKDATELMSSGAFCSHAKNVLIDELQEKIFNLILTLSQLIDMTTLSDEHMKLNTEMINWLHKIQPILERNAINYENIKYDMEESLMVKTNTLGKKISDLLPYLEILDEMDDINNTFFYLEDIRKLVHWMQDCEKEVLWINKEETVFKFPVSQYSDLEELKDYVLPFYELMYLLHSWRRSFHSWMDGPFEYIDSVQVAIQHEDYDKEFSKIFKQYKNKIKQQISDGNERRFKGLVEDPDPMNLPAPMKLCAQALNELKEWRPYVQLVNIMCNSALRQRHWDEMSKISGVDLTPNAGTTIRKLIKLNLWEEMEKYEIISVGACKELMLITNLNNMISEWENINFSLNTYKDKNIKILVHYDDTQAILDDHLTKTISMRGSAFVKPFENEVKQWYEKLVQINKTIDKWSQIQYQYITLLPFFSTNDIMVQMHQETIMFCNISNTYNNFIKMIEKTPLVLKSATGADLIQTLDMTINLIEKIKTGVNEYIEKKRLFFPRFFFLSNGEILKILKETEHPEKVQPHLKKCFENIYKLKIDSELNILGMYSEEDEYVEFNKIVPIKNFHGAVEKWLAHIEKQMVHTLQSKMKTSYDEYHNISREDWIINREGMIVLCVSQIFWTIEVHSRFKINNNQLLNEYHLLLNKQLNALLNIIRTSTISNSLRMTIKTLIIIDIHAKDVIQELIDKNVTKDSDFNWLAQLRYYWEDNMVIVRIINASVKYAYEYLGNTERLVITPLTERCYRTLVGTFDLHLNGAPEGPAATGKTETIKDLAKAIAKHCIIFNCSSDVECKLTARFFKGVASSGAWICLDEINRINVEVLSVVAQQILCIVQAIHRKVPKFYFEGTLLTINSSCFTCITMNPGHAGKSELPDNLKVLFRRVAMIIPDYILICEISLYSYGFSNVKEFASKILTVFRICSKQLSLEKHYDFGMRSLKAVLRTCQKNKIKYPEEIEDILLFRSLSEIYMPKLFAHDISLFKLIMSDVFPDLSFTHTDCNDIESELKEHCATMNLQSTDYFISKIIETYQIMNIYHGFMMIGDPFSGKTCVLKTLAATLCSLKIKNLNYDDVEYSIVNPKAVEPSLLFGSYNFVSCDWTDGVVANIFRSYSKEENTKRKWIIFDGPIDAVWIENMNTVLDDNKKLCLNSGEIISLSKTMSIIFEVTDVSQASPAAISRCGAIFMQSHKLGFITFVKSWINECNSNWRDGFEEYLLDICGWIFPPLLTYLKELDSPDMTGGEINLVLTSLKLVNMLMTDAISTEDDSKYLKTWIQASFVFGIVWGLGGNLNMHSKKKFDEFFKEVWKNDKNLPERLEKMDVSLPIEGLIIDYVYQYKQKGSWKSYQEIVKNTKIIETMNMQHTLIPTVDTVKYTFLLDIHIRYKTPMLFFGPTGTGKTFYTQKYIMNQLSLDNYTPIFIRFTSTTSVTSTKRMILSKLYKKKNCCYGPTNNKTALIFVDDMNMPTTDNSGAQPPIEVLRQVLDQKYWHDPNKLTILNTLIFGTVGSIGGGRQKLCSRMLRHFSIFATNPFSQDTITKIFTNILQIGWKRNGFGNDVSPVIASIICATSDIYASVLNTFLPTVKKPHYIYNIRDILRVIQGCLLIQKDSAENKQVFTKLWIHEIFREFYDRLNNDNDKEHFFSLLEKYVYIHFKEKLEEVCDTYQDSNGLITKESLKKLMFGTYLDSDTVDDDKKYEELQSLNLLEKKALDILEEYNLANDKKINIVLFQYALEHLSKICRVLLIPEGNILLVGINGSGRQSLTKLASIMMEKELFQPKISYDYNAECWHNDIKKILKQSGGLSKETVFLLTEEQILEDVFIEDIDNLLSSGEIPNLFMFDEKQEILELVRLDAQGGNRNLDIDALQVMDFFRARCKTKLHICLCLNPNSNFFQNKIRIYPSLVNNCTIDWFENWPEEALENVAFHYMEDINLSENIILSSTKVCKRFHMNAFEIAKKYYEKTNRHVYITNVHFLDVIHLFTKLIQEKQNELSLAKQRYINGLSKLSLAADAVTNIQRELNELKPQLIIMAVRGAEMMEEIERETIEADKATIQVREDEKVANEQAAAAQILKKDCEADLALAIPILEDAIAALNTLKPTDITLVKSMKNPPAAIKLVMAAVCVMKSIPPDRIPDPANPGRKMLDYWGPSKRLLGDMAFLQSLKEFDKDNIPVATMSKIRKEYLPHKDFKPHIIAKASTAAEGLCKWVIAMDMYDAVAKVVAPKKAKLQAAETEFAATMAILEEKKAMVARLEKKVADLHTALEEANLKKQQLEEEVELCINKLHRAEKLIGGLGGEKNRWTRAAENLQCLYDNLAGDIILSCGIIIYMAPFTTAERYSTILDWKNYILSLEIPISDNYLFSKVLGINFKIQSWYIFGLPKDPFSTDNAIIQSSSIKWSILIDPQKQANKWIKSIEKSNNINILNFSDSEYMKTIEKCVQLGMPVLIENILENLHISLDPILKRDIFNLNGKSFVCLGNDSIEYNNNFRFYLTTNLKNPHFSPDIFNKLTIINFALSKDGLEDQLLDIVVTKESPELQKKREKLIIETNENQAALKNIENNILKTLQETKGDILEDETAIEALDASKLLSVQIIKKREIMKGTEVMINDFRNSYYPVAQHSAIIYYCITDLSKINPMYQYSLSWFVNLYKFSIETANKSKNLEKRLTYIKETFTYNLYCNVTRSLFEIDKLTFSFILCSKILSAENKVTQEEINYFLTCDSSINMHDENPIEWLPNNLWQMIFNLSQMAEFECFKESFIDNKLTWEKIYESLEPQEEFFPTPLNVSTFSFKKLLIVRILRPDKLTAAITKYVIDHIGDKYVEPPPFDISKSFNDSNCLLPIIFILSPNSNPLETIIKFSEVMGFKNKMSHISLGQGQDGKAKSMVTQAQTEGAWVCLQNCHLSILWLNELENICDKINLSNTDVGFRLWLTSSPTHQFPQTILESGIKIIDEAPTGLKKNLKRLYSSELLKNPKFFEGCPGKDKFFSKLLYGMCFFHVIIQERKRFGSLGWNIPYNFSDTDFQISVRQLQNFINQSCDIPYTALSYLTGECSYGGRVTDDWDRRLIITILKNYLNPDLVNNSKYNFSTVYPEYTLPKRCEYHDYLQHIENIPTYTPPEIYGLHANAGVYRNHNLSTNILKSLFVIYNESINIACEEDKDKLLITICDDILKKLPPQFNIEDVRKKFNDIYNQSMNMFMLQEMDRFNVLLQVITTSLDTLLKSVKGLIIMNSDMENQMKSILMGNIPKNWSTVSYPSLKPLGSYILDLIERLHMFKLWFEDGIPLKFWFSGFYFTQGFLISVLQNYARKKNVPIDNLTFDCEVVRNSDDVIQETRSVYIYGPVFEGARWNFEKHILDEQQFRIFHESIPTMKLFIINNNDMNESGKYRCPFYKTLERNNIAYAAGPSSNYIFSLLLPTEKTTDHWVKRNAAIILQLDD